MGKRRYIQNSAAKRKTWRVKELCAQFGIEPAGREYKTLAGKAALFAGIGEGIYTDPLLAGEVILTHPLKSLSEEENLILAAAVSCLNGGEAGFPLTAEQKAKAGELAQAAQSALERPAKTDFSHFIHKYVKSQVQTVCELTENRENFSDPETIHDIRVAFRRVLSVCSLFAEHIRPDWQKQFIPGMKKSFKKLGSLRDVDVMIDHLTVFTQDVSIIDSYQIQREKRLQDAIEYYTSATFGDFLRELALSLEQPIVCPAIEKDARVRAFHIEQIKEQKLENCLTEIFAYEEWLQGLYIPEPMLHQLRLGFKKLRYVLDFFDERLGPEAKKLTDACKCFQDLLGDLHDYTILIADLASGGEGHGDLIADLEAQCEKLCDKIVKEWASFTARKYKYNKI